VSLLLLHLCHSPAMPAWSTDWLLNHPNVDILQQWLLSPLLDAARMRDRQQADPAGSSEAPLLRLQVITLAPCVSNYTLHFLREMAFNVTEGHTYAGGCFRSID